MEEVEDASEEVVTDERDRDHDEADAGRPGDRHSEDDQNADIDEPTDDHV